MVYPKVVMLGAVCGNFREKTLRGQWSLMWKLAHFDGTCQQNPSPKKTTKNCVCQQKKTPHIFHLIKTATSFFDLRILWPLQMSTMLPRRLEGPTRASSLSATKRAAEVYGRDLHRRPSPCRLRPPGILANQTDEPCEWTLVFLEHFP